MQKLMLSFLCGTVSVLAVSTAMAQQSNGLEEITVTARKRTESLQDVPVAVAAIPKSELAKNMASDLNKIGELAPQVLIGRSVTGTGATITIRGISSSAVDSGLDQSVAIDMDGVPLSRGRIVQTAVFDLQQVAVLEGPQALFFGKNSPAGVISITSADPTNKLEGYVKGGYEFKAKEKYVEGAVGGPITDDLKGRIALRGDWMDGWLKNIAPAEANPFQPNAPLPGAQGQSIGPKGHDISGRLTLLWEPTDDFNAKLKVTMNSERENSNDAGQEPFCVGQSVPTVLGVPEPTADCKANMVKAESDLPPLLAINYPYANGGMPYMRSDLGLASLTLNKTFDKVTLTSTTGYYDQSHKGGYTGDVSEFAQIYDTEYERYHLFTQELRANTNFDGPLNVMAGGYYEHSHRRWFNAPDLLNIFNPVAQNYTTTTTTSLSHSNSWSVFGQARWKIIPELELAGGVRYSHDSKQSTLENFTGNPAASALGLALYPDGTPINANYKGNNVSPEATLTWKPTPNQTIYGAYKTGYKAGGISNAAVLPAAATSSNVLFGAEKTNGFEAGYKADLMERTLRLDLTGYRYNYNGLQVTGYIPTEFRYTIANAAKARTYGVTGSFEYLATERLTLSGNVGWNHARYLSFPNAQCYGGQTAAQGCVGGVQDLKGKALMRAPNVTFKLGADYKAPLGNSWVADLSASAAYSGSYQTETDYGVGGFQSSYWLINAGITVSPEDDKYHLSLLGRNLTNSYYKVFTYQRSLATFNEYSAFFNRPREVVLEVGYNF